MSDLISRSNLIMRLCDYALQESPNDNESEGEQRISKMIYEVIQNCIACVEEQPTAYDVDKVVEELEERTDFLKDCKKYGNKNAGQQEKSYSTMMMYEVADLVDDLIEIVKQGGVYDDVCEWKIEETTSIVWHCKNECTTYNPAYAKNLKTILDDFECKCPYCGKKIKVEELEMYLNFRNHIDRLFFPKFSEECEIVGAYEGEKEIGFLCVINGYIEGIWVEPEHRRRGKAKQMVFDYISKYGIPSRLHILNNNIPAQKFWNSIFNLSKVEETNIDILYSIIGVKEMESD